MQSQIEILTINNSTLDECDGSIALLSSELEISFTLQGPNQDQIFQFAGSNLGIDQLCDGNYTIVYSDELGCEIKIDFVIVACPSIDFNASVKSICFGDNSGYIELEDPNDGNSYDYIWSNGKQGTIIEDLSAGDYTVTITNQNNCKTINTYTVVNSSPSIKLKSLSDLDSEGTLIIDIIDGKSPFTITWKDPLNIITEVSADGLEVLINNSSQIPTTLTATVVDANGCLVEKSFPIKSCLLSNLDFQIDILNSESCDEADNLRLNISSTALYVKYKVEKIAPVPTGWATVSQGESEVLEDDKGRFIKVEMGDANLSTYRITLTDECNSTKTVEDKITCECENTIAPILVLDSESCHLGEDLKLRLLRDQVDIEYLCLVSNYYNDVGICSFQYPWTFTVELPDNSIFEVSANENGFITWETIIPSDKVDPENGDYDFEIEEEGVYYFSTSNGPGCLNEYYYNFEYVEFYSIGGAGILGVLGEPAQGFNFTCNSCKEPQFPSSYFLDNLDAYCLSGSLGLKEFQWGPFNLEFPFSMGGVYNVIFAGQVYIPPGTPFINVPLNDSYGPNCQGALFPWEFGQGPVYQGYPIFVVYCPTTSMDPDQDGCLIDCDCENEWAEDIGNCNLEVSCLDDDPDNPTVLGVIPNLQSITPCQAFLSSGCEVIGFCLESNSYYLYENGEYYYYTDLDCSNLDIPYCTDVENGTAVLYDTNCELPCQVFQNSPNPFSTATVDLTIPFCISTSGFPQLLVYDNTTGSLAFSKFNDYTVAGISSFEIPKGTLPVGTYSYYIENDGCTSNELNMIALTFTGNDDVPVTRNTTEASKEPQNENQFDEDSFKVFPNPNNGTFNILNESESIISNINMYNLTGQKVDFSLSHGTDFIQISLDENVQPGIYILEIISADSKSLHRIIAI